ncbi:MAG: sigma-54-dependent transcriptional regulator [Candidatus Hydrogenedentota bacterium]
MIADSSANPAPAGAAGESPEALRVLVVDTDPGVRWALERALSRSGYTTLAASNVGDALRLAATETPAITVMEILPEAGLTQEVLSMLMDKAGDMKVVCVSGDADPRLVIDCMRRGAADFVPKPFGVNEIRSSLSKLVSNKRPTPRRAQHQEGGDTPASFLVGVSPAIQELRNVITQVAKTDLNCLLRGESGVGKDMAAREIHRLSNRCDKPLIKVNCVALPEQLLESELFGYEKGAFTGANTSKPGRFELAHRGIIFLDEIGEMDMNLQSKLLQVIEHKEFTKLGGRKSISVDVQIVAATNVNLEERTKKGQFRQDLFFRLNEVGVKVPSLAERREDIPLLVRHFLKKHGHFDEGPPYQIAGEDLDYLIQHPWPGNVRELESTVKRWMAIGKRADDESIKRLQRPVTVPPRQGKHGGEKTGDDPLDNDRSPTGAGDSPPTKDGAPTPKRGDVDPESPAPPQPPPQKPLSKPMSEEERLERQNILEALEHYQWNRRKAAQSLGISYQTLRRRIVKYELDT